MFSEVWKHRCDFNELLGLTLTAVDGAEVGSDEIVFTAEDGTRFLMCHRQDCCEDVRVEDVVGDVDALVGSPILMAEEVSAECGEPKPENAYDESWTWTFYKLATQKGYVTLRWLGVSNGFYSESVDFAKYPPK